MSDNTETIIKALVTYKSYMIGLSRANNTFGNTNYADYCIVEAHKAEEALQEIRGE